MLSLVHTQQYNCSTTPTDGDGRQNHEVSPQTMVYDEFPLHMWIHEYIDGSATTAIKFGEMMYSWHTRKTLQQ